MTRPSMSLQALLEMSLNLERFGGWLAVLANVGVIVGLILLATALVSPADLTDEEILQMWAYLNATVISAEQTYSMYSLGLATQEGCHSAAKKSADWISFPFGRIWRGEMKTIFPKSLASDIDAAFRLTPREASWDSRLH
jgi:hypothetical protein